MQPGNNILRQEALEYVRNEVMQLFGEDMELKEEKSDWEHHGWFMLVFQYVPKKYRICFEREFHSFHVRITNEDGGFIALEQIVDYENRITGENIEIAVSKLKRVLEGEISFYKIIHGKRCRQTDGQQKRVKE